MQQRRARRQLEIPAKRRHSTARHSLCLVRVRVERTRDVINVLRVCLSVCLYDGLPLSLSHTHIGLGELCCAQTAEPQGCG